MVVNLLAAIVGGVVGFVLVKFGVPMIFDWSRDGYRSTPEDTPRRAVADAIAVAHRAQLAARVPDSCTIDAGAEAGADPSLSEIPDLIEPIIGWRCWGINKDGTLRALTSPHAYLGFGYHSWGVEWPPRKTAAAACEKLERSGFYRIIRELSPDREPPKNCEHVPEESCSCGFYAARRLRDVPNYEHGVAYGLVAMWGKVIEHNGGWRAQYAYPVNLTVLDHYEWKGETGAILNRIRDLYGVPVRLGTRDELADLRAAELAANADVPDQIMQLLPVAEEDAA